MPDPIIDYLPPWFVNSLAERSRRKLRRIPAFVGDIPWYYRLFGQDRSGDPRLGGYYQPWPPRYVWLRTVDENATTPMHEAIHAIDPHLDPIPWITESPDMPDWRYDLIHSPRLDEIRYYYTGGGASTTYWTIDEFLPLSLQTRQFALSMVPAYERAAWLRSGLFNPIAAVPREAVEAGFRSWQHEGRKLGMEPVAEPFPNVYPPSPPQFTAKRAVDKPQRIADLLKEQLFETYDAKRRRQIRQLWGKGWTAPPPAIGMEHY